MTRTVPLLMLMLVLGCRVKPLRKASLSESSPLTALFLNIYGTCFKQTTKCSAYRNQVLKPQTPAA